MTSSSQPPFVFRGWRIPTAAELAVCWSCQVPLPDKSGDDDMTCDACRADGLGPQ